jgi:hypothetical protein
MTSMARPVNAGSYSMTVRSSTPASGKKTQAVPQKKQKIETPVSSADETKLSALARKFSVGEGDIVYVAKTLSKAEQADFIRAADGARETLSHFLEIMEKAEGDYSPTKLTL